MGQCGQGHSQSPVTRPKRVVGLNKVPVHQISAGTSHSVAWTAIPSDRYKFRLADSCSLRYSCFDLYCFRRAHFRVFSKILYMKVIGPLGLRIKEAILTDSEVKMESGVKIRIFLLWVGEAGAKEALHL